MTAAAIIAVAHGAAPQVASAQGAGEKRAEDLFRAAKQDVEAGRFDEACPKFEASYRVSDNPGALLSWADCEEKRNKLATALRLWEEGAGKVASDAERARYVAERVAALKPRVPQLVGDRGGSHECRREARWQSARGHEGAHLGGPG